MWRAVCACQEAEVVLHLVVRSGYDKTKNNRGFGDHNNLKQKERRKENQQEGSFIVCFVVQVIRRQTCFQWNLFSLLM